MLKLLATDGPLKSVTKPISDAVDWVTGKTEDKNADGHADGHAEGGEASAEQGEGLTSAAPALVRG